MCSPDRVGVLNVYPSVMGFLHLRVRIPVCLLIIVSTRNIGQEAQLRSKESTVTVLWIKKGRVHRPTSTLLYPVPTPPQNYFTTYAIFTFVYFSLY